MKSGSNDIFLSAQIKYMENISITTEVAERILRADSRADALKILEGEGYWTIPEQSPTLEWLLERRRKELFSMIAAGAKNDFVLRVFRMKYDFHNIKTIVKAEHTTQDAKPMISATGNVDKEKVLSAIEDRDYSALPKYFSETLTHAKSLLTETESPFRADCFVDKACFSEMKKQAEKSTNSLLVKYVKAKIDAANLKTAIRLRSRNDAESLAQSLISGGTVSVKAIAESDDIAQLFSNTEFAAAASENSEDAAELESACDKAFARIVAAGKFQAFGEEVQIAFLERCESEEKQIRILFAKMMQAFLS